MNAATERNLGELADKIEAAQVELDRLYQQRGDLWAAAIRGGASQVELAAASRVKSTTVRQWQFVRREGT